MGITTYSITQAPLEPSASAQTPDPLLDQSSHLTLLTLLALPTLQPYLLPHLPLQTLINLSKTARSYHKFIFSSQSTPQFFRFLTLTHSRGAYTPPVTRADSGGHSWRAERIDENLSEDDWFSGPLRSVLNTLSRRNLLSGVRVLVLDGLASVTHDVLFELLTETRRYTVQLLSVRGCINVNMNLLQRTLIYICRPDRPKDTPKVRGVYVFTNPADDEGVQVNEVAVQGFGVTGADGATLGLRAGGKGGDGCFRANAEKWYSPSGRVIMTGSSRRVTWEEVLVVCKGIIAFDTVSCGAMHRHIGREEAWDQSGRDEMRRKPGVPPLATVGLGSGCAGCGSIPDDVPTWSEDDADIWEFPLLAPPPWSGKLVDAVRPPRLRDKEGMSNGMVENKRLIVACTWCLKNRHCESCHRWWCTDCFHPRAGVKSRELESRSHYGVAMDGEIYRESGLSVLNEVGDSVKLFNGLCVEHCLVPDLMTGAGGGGMWG